MKWRYWKPTLVNGERPLLNKTNRVIPPNSLIICRQLEYRGYDVFYPYYTFIQESYKMNAKERCFYEVILGNQAQKPYFDLDIDSEKPEFYGWDLRKAKEAVMELKRCIIALANEQFRSLSVGMQDSDIMVFSSHGSGKFSFHVVVDRWCFPDVTSNRYFCQRVIDSMDVEMRMAVDYRVYKTLQQFRTYMSTKYQKGRTKILESDDLCSWTTKASSEGRRYYQISLASFITITSYCHILGYEIPDKPVRNWIEQDDLPDAAVDAITSSLEIVIDGTFDIVNVEGRRVDLKRKRAGYCLICEREHENENAFLTVNGNGVVYYHCFRADTATKVMLSAIDSKLLEQTLPEFSKVDYDRETDEVSESPVRATMLKTDITSTFKAPLLSGLKLYKSMTSKDEQKKSGLSFKFDPKCL